MPSILITGANRGLGLGFARQFAADGWRVFATCRGPAAATELAELAAAAQGRVTTHALDVDDFGAIDDLAAKLSGEAIDVLLNNAGITGPKPQGFGEVDYAGWAEVMHTNVLAVMKLTEAFVGHIAASERKLIVNVSSGLSSMERKTEPLGEGLSERYIYRSSKAALNMLTKGLAVDLADRGISVVAVAPGWVRTDLGGPHALFSVEESMANVCPMIDGFGPAQSGKIFLYDGKEYPW